MPIEDAGVDEFAELFRRFLERMAAPAGSGPSLADRIRDHQGVDPIGLSAIGESFELWDHANVQAALDAYLAQPGTAAQLVGVLGGQKRMFGVGLCDLLVSRTGSVAGMPGSGAQAGPGRSTTSTCRSVRGGRWRASGTASCWSTDPRAGWRRWCGRATSATDPGATG